MAKQLVWALDFEVFETLFKESTGIEDSPEIQTMVVDDTSGIAFVIMRVTEDSFDELEKDVSRAEEFQFIQDPSPVLGACN